MRQNSSGESCGGVNWSVSARLKPADGATQLVKSPEASFRTQATSLVLTVSYLVVTSPVAKRGREDQSVRTHAL